MYCSWVSANALEEVLLSTVQRLSRLVLNDEKGFAKELQSMWEAKQGKKPQQGKSDLQRVQKQYDDLSDKIRGLYENFAAGLVPERQYKQLMKQYDDEQAEIEVRIEQLKSELAKTEIKPLEIDKFIALIKKYKHPTEVSDLMLRELVDRIVVHEGTGQGIHREQQIDIYFNFVGLVNIAYSEEEIAEEQARVERMEQEKLNRQRQREKAYREKRKAKKLAENGGETVKKRVCQCCGEEFTPTSNHQRFCSPNCRYVFARDEKQAKEGGHVFAEKNCMVCGKLFTPTHNRQTICSEECRKKYHAEVTLEAYHKKQAEKRNGGHAYPERVCEVCGKRFWPDSPSAKVCSEDCRLEKKRRESRAAYARQRQGQAEKREIA